MTDRATFRHVGRRHPRETLQKMLEHSQPPGYRQTAPKKERKIDRHVGWIQAVLDGDREIPRKQRHTAARIFARLKNERGYRGGYTAAKEPWRNSER
ncbi:MAG: hypothetical protein AAF514_03430 [Verrucomicrobiota bacterium]